MTPLEITAIVLLTIILVVLVYFGINYIQSLRKPSQLEETMESIPYTSSFEDEKALPIPPQVQSFASHTNVPESQPLPVRENINEPEKVPEIPGTTPEELAEPEPLQRRVSQKVDKPASFDKLETNDNQALFGDNLRHPEAMVTKTDNYSTLETDIASGIANTVAVPEELPKSQFGSDMIQNGGEFMKGINAFDMSDSKTWFSNL